jgi:hypothetical protein
MSDIAFLPKEFIQFRAESNTVNIDERTISLVASDETPVDRFSWERWEPYKLILSHDPKHVNLERVASKVALFFDGHPGGFFSTSNRLGKITSANVANGRMTVKVKLNQSDAANRYLQDVQDGTEPGNSVGIDVNELQVIQKAKYESDESGDKILVSPMVVMATDWTLLELSAVDIPANPNANTLSKEDREKFDKLPKSPVRIIGDKEDLSYFTSKVTLAKEDNSNMTTLDNQEKSEKNTQLSDKNRELQIQLAAAEKEKTETLARFQSQSLELEYYKLRCQALDLFAVQNKMTEEDYNLDFGSPSDDIERFKAMEPEDAKIELRVIDRNLRRASLKAPIERVPEKAKAMLSNESVKSKTAELSTPKHPTEPDTSEELKQQKEADDFLATYTPRKIG